VALAGESVRNGSLAAKAAMAASGWLAAAAGQHRGGCGQLKAVAQRMAASIWQHQSAAGPQQPQSANGGACAGRKISACSRIMASIMRQ